MAEAFDIAWSVVKGDEDPLEDFDFGDENERRKVERAMGLPLTPLSWEMDDHPDTWGDDYTPEEKTHLMATISRIKPPIGIRSARMKDAEK